VNEIPAWAVASAGLAPVLLVGGWTLTSHRQPAGYDAIRETISALASRGATDRWVMTSGLVGLGLCHVVTAVGLRPARTAGRVVLAGGGVATVFVAAFPLPAQGSSQVHAIATVVSLIALGAWPVVAARRTTPNPALRPGESALASSVLLGCVAWFAGELRGRHTGLAERVAAGAQAFWPLVVVGAARRSAEVFRSGTGARS
jgi:hypothetical membrane protein